VFACQNAIAMASSAHPGKLLVKKIEVAFMLEGERSESVTLSGQNLSLEVTMPKEFVVRTLLYFALWPLIILAGMLGWWVSSNF
jgi:hypothetical protein